jgi:RNA polymerase sigma factor (sigma-70 family)
MPGKENDACAKAILGCFEALYRTAYRLTGNKAQAEDLVQETYLRAWRSLSQLHDLSGVQPWMFRILRTVFIDQLGRESSRPKLVQRYVPEFEKRWSRYARPVGDSWRVTSRSKAGGSTSIAPWIKRAGPLIFS